MSARGVSSEDGQSTTVVLADADRMGCQLLADKIQRYSHLRVVGSATTRQDVISAVRKLQPDIAVINSRLSDGKFAGLLVLPELNTLQTRPRVIMLLDDDQPKLVVEAFRNGAHGIFCRTEVATEVRKCIRACTRARSGLTTFIWSTLSRRSCRHPCPGWPSLQW